MPNAERLRAAMDAVLAADAEDRWNQGLWVDTFMLEIVKHRTSQDELDVHLCRTAGCFAGWGAFNAGYTIYTIVDCPGCDWCSNWEGTHQISVLKHPVTGLMMSLDEDEVSDVPLIAEWAEEYFDLTPSQARELFGPDNDLETLKAMVDQLCSS